MIGLSEGPSLRRRRTASTLLELMVTLALLAILAGVAPLALRPSDPIRGDDPLVRLTVARRTALRTGRPVTITTSVAGAIQRATALPDGSVVADSVFHVDRLTGVRRGMRMARGSQSHAP